MQKITLLTLISLLCFNLSSRAQDSTAAAADADEGKLTFGGYIDEYYLHAFNNPASGNLMGYGQANNIPGATNIAPAGRAFDRLTDQFALGLVQFKAMYSNKKSDMVIDLTFGPNAELGNFGNQKPTLTVGTNSTTNGYVPGFYPNNPYQNQLYGSGIAIKQAYWTYKATEKLSFTVGQFGTHIGYEVIDAPINYHYSLSNLFNNGPFYHIGAKANYAFSDKLGLMVGVVNNWDAMTDWKKQKSVIAQLFIKPVAGWNVYINYIGGYNDDGFKAFGGQVSNAAYTAPGFRFGRNLFDLTTGYQITSKFYLGLNAAYGFYASSDAAFKTYAKQTTQLYSGGSGKNILDWGGIAGYANYAITDVVGIGVRYEHFQDKYGVRYIGATNNSLTITVPITLASGHLIIKPEFRMDTSPATFGKDAAGNTEYYYEKYRNGVTTSTKTQTTLGTAFIYKF